MQLTLHAQHWFELSTLAAHLDTDAQLLHKTVPRISQTAHAMVTHQHAPCSLVAANAAANAIDMQVLQCRLKDNGGTCLSRHSTMLCRSADVTQKLTCPADATVDGTCNAQHCQLV